MHDRGRNNNNNSIQIHRWPAGKSAHAGIHINAVGRLLFSIHTYRYTFLRMIHRVTRVAYRATGFNTVLAQSDGDCETLRNFV